MSQFTWKLLPTNKPLIVGFPKKSEGFSLRAFCAFVVEFFFGISSKFIHGVKPVAIQLQPVEWSRFAWKLLPTNKPLIVGFPKKSEGFSFRALCAFVVKFFFGILSNFQSFR